MTKLPFYLYFKKDARPTGNTHVKKPNLCSNKQIEIFKIHLSFVLNSRYTRKSPSLHCRLERKSVKYLLHIISTKL